MCLSSIILKNVRHILWLRFLIIFLLLFYAQAGEWNLLNEKIIELTKKRSQLKMAVAKMVAECCTFLDR